MTKLQAKVRRATDKVRLTTVNNKVLANSTPCSYTEIVYKPVYWTVFNQIVKG